MTEFPQNHAEYYVRGGQVTSVDGTTIRYLARGRGPVVVCLHGALGTALSLLPLSNYLAEDFALVFVNLRGHGTSGWGQSPPSIDRHVEDVLAVVEPSDRSKHCLATPTERSSLWKPRSPTRNASPNSSSTNHHFRSPTPSPTQP